MSKRRIKIQLGKEEIWVEVTELVLERNVAHGRHPVLWWMMDNIFVWTNPAGNIKLDKEKSAEKIDGAVEAIMALDRAVRNGGSTGSVYGGSFDFGYQGGGLANAA